MKRVVLVRTNGPRNVGSVMRAVANFGPAELVLVAPQRRSMLVHPDFTMMAHGVENVRDRIRVVATLGEALEDTTRSVAFTARPRDGRVRVDWRERTSEFKSACDDPAQRIAFVFGSEADGLDAAETDACKEIAYLPTSAEHQSLNLATAVSIVLFTLYTGDAVHKRERGPRLSSERQLAFLREHLKAVLGSKVALSLAAKRDIEQSIDRVFTRVPIESRDARAWHMMMRALGSELAPRDFGIGGPARDQRRDDALERRVDEALGESDDAQA
ncbi:MAG: RNA methyltransferase [Planctomycetes bacterium]|nr:RNA methyltransferase [Planctomycetota bacterium]